MNCPGYRNVIAGKFGHSGIAWGLEHRVASKRLSKRDTVQIVGTDLGSEAWANCVFVKDRKV